MIGTLTSIFRIEEHARNCKVSAYCTMQILNGFMHVGLRLHIVDSNTIWHTVIVNPSVV